MNRLKLFVIIGLFFWIIPPRTIQARHGIPPQDASTCGTKSGAVGFTSLDQLPALPDFHAVHQFSSHNKRGMNGDSGWRLYDDLYGDAVIFDVEGPGCIRSMWSTNFHDDAVFKFYFDGEDVPRYELPMLDFFKGKHPLFPPPLNSYERRGRWGTKPFAGNSFVPIPFAKSLKISVRGEFEFYHVLFQRYPHGTEVTTFTGQEDRSYLLGVFQSLDGPLPDPEGMQVQSVAIERIDPGAVASLWEVKQSGLIRQLTIEGEGSDAFLQDVMIQMRWDDHPYHDVHAPLGFFFGSAVHPTAMRSFPVRLEKLADGRIQLISRFPMPFQQNASIQLVNCSSRAIKNVRAEMYLDSLAQVIHPAQTDLKTTVLNEHGFQAKTDPLLPEQLGYFTTCYRRGTTTYGRDWLLFESPGTGWFLGAVQSMRGEHYCEGDEHFYIDGAVSPQIHGTGSEDYYLGCFWPNVNFNSPFANCVGDIQEEGGGTFKGSYAVPTCYSRFHLDAPIPFFNHIDARIQHGGMNTISSHYGSLAFAYLRQTPSLEQNDMIDVGLPFSEQAHAYQARDSKPYGPISSFPEGEYFDAAIRDEGRIHEAGEISFTVAINPKNAGIRIRRRLDQGHPRQTADVSVDGEFVGVWYHPDQNKHLRWFDSDFDIHSKYTKNKDRIRVTLKIRTGADRGPFTDFRYEVYSLVP